MKDSKFLENPLHFLPKKSKEKNILDRPGRTPIGPRDFVSIEGRYLYKGDDKSRFFLRGIAFPIPPPSPQKIDIDGWIAVLEQLASETDINTIRVYDMDCQHTNSLYNPFLKRAAELGIYVIVPFTSSSGDGNLSRDDGPPDCYPRKLFEYGKACIDRYWNHPNVIMGVVGNEVMNSFVTFKSAPCVKAYLDDLAEYGRLKAHKSLSSKRTSFPLMYATQHDSPTANLFPDDAIKLTYDYLSCKRANENSDLDFVYGINIESWCSSSETFELEEDGLTESSYHSLWNTFSGGNKTIEVIDAVAGTVSQVEVAPVAPNPIGLPVIFSEMGCSKRDFNRDNPVVPENEKHIRDWKQIPLVSSKDGDMADLWSGFVAYAYDGGGSNFRMMGDENSIWNGKDLLPHSQEYENFRDELAKVSKRDAETVDSIPLGTSKGSAMLCANAVMEIQKNFGIELYPLYEMPTYLRDRKMATQIQLHGMELLGTDSTTYAHLETNRSIPWMAMSLFGILMYGLLIARRSIDRKKMIIRRKGDHKHCHEASVTTGFLGETTLPNNYGTV